MQVDPKAEFPRASYYQRMIGQQLRGIALLGALLLAASCGSDGSASPTPGATGGAPAEATPTPTSTARRTGEVALSLREFPVPPGSRPHDVAPAEDGGVWYTAQGSGESFLNLQDVTVLDTNAQRQTTTVEDGVVRVGFAIYLPLILKDW